MKKKTYVVACAVLSVDMKSVAQTLGIDLDYKFLEAGLHNNPKLLSTKLQNAIDEISAKGDGDRIIIGYGVCGKGTIGIHSRQIPLVIPKVHDCIALFLGGDQAYKDQFRKYPGTYYLSAGWCEENRETLAQRQQRAWFGSERLQYSDLVKSHGKKTADHTFNFLNSWQKNYQRAAFIETGARQSVRYEAQAREMAKAYNWKFEKIQGEQTLIRKLLTAGHSTREILVVPPEHVIGFDAITATLSANPVWDREKTETQQFPGPAPGPKTGDMGGTSLVKTGLGIDAGGTYTDAVVYDLTTRTTRTKAKSLTTKWDFTNGIGKALKKLDLEQLKRVELVALSTTLATNAIVENQGQKVGMILMPPLGLAENIAYEPKAVVQGELNINGEQKIPVNPEQIRSIARRMINTQQVTAFAVSGYAGSINPVHELKVKQILEQETGLFVCCGHELSDTLNFQTRAVTAMLNARITPRLSRLLIDLEAVMADFGIQAPIVVVKGDGTLMGSDMAKKRPVETILSGPAASVAGARHLTGLTDALVVDMGGTTTDTAVLCNNQVTLNESGSNVGGQRTHVKALEIRTTGLGGDSLIQFKAGEFSIGPRRVAPIAWLGQTWPGAKKTLSYLGQNLNRYTATTQRMQILVYTGAHKNLILTPLEQEILSLLKQRPLSIDELVVRTGVLSHVALPLDQLEENFLIQRCGLTPTDLLHITGQFEKWDTEFAREYCRFYALISGRDMDEMIGFLMRAVTRRLTLELLKRQLDDEVNPDNLDTCPVCRTLMDNLLDGGNTRYRVSITMNRPIIGIGAPIKFFLADAAKTLGSNAILPEDADVANAIGAITSRVVIKKQLRIIPGNQGGFIVEGICGSPAYKDFQDADLFAREKLTLKIQRLAREAGSSATRVGLTARDNITKTATGESIFMERILTGALTGYPDLVLKQHSSPAMTVDA